jgi:hypothetical protein
MICMIVNVCIYVSMCPCMYVCMHISSVYACMNVFMYLCAQVCMRVSNSMRIL